MRVAQFYDEGRVRVGRVEGEFVIPLSGVEDVMDLMQRDSLAAAKGPSRPLAAIRWAPAVTRPSKIIAIGLNYRDHAAESKGAVPAYPLVFAKFPSSLTGHEAPVEWDPAVTRKVDYEAELAVIIGRRARAVAQDEALGVVFGYTCANDVSARDLQFGDGQWVRGKSLDSFCPLGPWIVTADEIKDPNALAIACRLNGRLVQDSHTERMIFPVPALISFLSAHFTLYPGDVILTGTPSGVGAFRDPPCYLKDGDEVTVSIEGIGQLRNVCRPRAYEQD